MPQGGQGGSVDSVGAFLRMLCLERGEGLEGALRHACTSESACRLLDAARAPGHRDSALEAAGVAELDARRFARERLAFTEAHEQRDEPLEIAFDEAGIPLPAAEGAVGAEQHGDHKVQQLRRAHRQEVASGGGGVGGRVLCRRHRCCRCARRC